jgi:hypothetical protein
MIGDIIILTIIILCMVFYGKAKKKQGPKDKGFPETRHGEKRK